VGGGELVTCGGEWSDAGSDCFSSRGWKGERWRLDGKEEQQRISGERVRLVEDLAITGVPDSSSKVAGSGGEWTGW
jgi:hypothetical protein